MVGFQADEDSRRFQTSFLVDLKGSPYFEYFEVQRFHGEFLFTEFAVLKGVKKVRYICFKKLKIDDTATSGQVRKHHAIKEIKGRSRNTSSSIQY